MSKDSTQRPRPDSNRGPFDPKSDAVTDWPLRLHKFSGEPRSAQMEDQSLLFFPFVYAVSDCCVFLLSVIVFHSLCHFASMYETCKKRPSVYKDRFHLHQGGQVFLCKILRNRLDHFIGHFSDLSMRRVD